MQVHNLLLADGMAVPVISSAGRKSHCGMISMEAFSNEPFYQWFSSFWFTSGAAGW